MFFIFNVLVPLFRPSLFRVVFFFLYFNLRKQPEEVFCGKRCSGKFRKFHRKTPALESLFHKVVGLGFSVKIKTLKHCENLLKVSYEIKQYVKNTTV